MLRLLCLFAFTITAVPSFATEPMNVVFFLVDDLGQKDIGIEGSSFYETPHIDGLAKSGMRFTHGYATCEVCSPSRASIMLGKYPARIGITDWIGAATGMRWNRNDRVLPAENLSSLPHEDISLAEAMKNAGYKTFFAGKWHLGGEGSFPEDHGFDINKGGHHRGSPPGGFFSPYKNPKLDDGPKGESLTLRLASETVDFIEDHKDERFFAYLSFYAVHAPIQTTPELQAKYTQKAIDEGLADKRFLFDRTMPVRQVQDNPVYAGMMETVDQAVGQVLNKLEELDLAKNTIVVFTSDNGGVSSGDAYATSNLPLRGGKGRQWEGGIREPFYIRAPGVTEPGSTSTTPVTGTDFYPTLLELTGMPLKPQQHVDGVSLLPLLTGNEIKDRDLFWHYPHYGNQGGEPCAIIRSKDWKLIHYYEDGRDELYRLSEDIGEKTDLAADHPQVTQRLRKNLDDWLKETGALIPVQDSRFDPVKKKQQLEQQKTKRLEALERSHAKYFE
ncbi:sulfatase [Planctomicrobium sp.]|nr:sulfatase [Planctomicrobium sp.]MDB4742859.1 sulfatase [Planctomicrobium sp.]